MIKGWMGARVIDDWMGARVIDGWMGARVIDGWVGARVDEGGEGHSGVEAVMVSGETTGCVLYSCHEVYDLKRV